MNHRLVAACHRLITRTQRVLDVLTGKLLATGTECESLHQIAIAASQERAICEVECDALRQIEQAAWEEYWNCITP